MHSAKKRFIAILMTVIMACSSVMVASAYEAPVDARSGRTNARSLSKEAAIEGMVLLKNEVSAGTLSEALPLARGESVAIFGINQIDFIHGGGGSGDSVSEYYVNLYQGMKTKEEEGKLTLYNGLHSAYQNYFNTSWSTDITYSYGTRQGAVIRRYGELPLTDEQVATAANEAETAIISIGRTAGEGSDRKDEKGDFQLTDNEVKLINQVKAQRENGNFKKLIVVLNILGIMETSWFKDETFIDAVLLVYTPGMEGGSAMADVLCGDAYPSGKLVDTWARKRADYPAASNFGNSSFTNYEEDIFVGYRYFETIPDAADKVNYEFGFGLSYAELDITNTKVDVTGTGRNREVKITATVKNNSRNYAGKEVVQVYCEAPEGNMTQPKKKLAAFAKTNELAPGASETVTMHFPFDDLASYDDVGKTGNQAAYVLEAGEYRFHIGNSVRNTSLAGSYSLTALEKVEQLANRLVPNTANLTRRMKSDGTYETLAATAAAPKTEETQGRNKYDKPAAIGTPLLSFDEVIEEVSKNPSLLNTEDIATLTRFVNEIPDEDLVHLVGCTLAQEYRGHRTTIGSGRGGSDALSFRATSNAQVGKYGIPRVGSTNGPAGIQWNLDRNGAEGGPDSPNKQQLMGNDPNRNATLFPSATMQASTWNLELMERIGAAMGVEASFLGISLWQAPGVNIHRDPLCGRNFEYFSEDPFVTGKMASHITKGVQSQKLASQLKHFAANNQETGRMGNDSRISERALREIYLKGYEIAIKESNPWSIMSCYNKINGVQGSASFELMTEILRYEWGWDGFTMTDFNNGVNHWDEVIAGGDLKARESTANPAGLLTRLANGTLPRWQVRRSAERVLRFLLKSEAGNDLALKKPIKASFEQSGNEITNVNDGNDLTRWSAYGATGGRSNHWIEVDLGDVYNVERVSMMPYTSTQKQITYDRIYDYEIWVKDTPDAAWSNSNSEDNSKDFASSGYTKVGGGKTSMNTLSGEKALVKETFTMDAPVRARYVALRVPDGRTESGTEADVSLYTFNVYGWKMETDHIIDPVDNSINIPSNAAAADLLNTVKLSGDNGLSLFIENGDTLTVQDCIGTIYASYEIAVASKTNLSAKIDEASGKEQWRYTSAAWDGLQYALSSARSINQKNDATKREIDEATNALTAAINGLVTIKHTVTLNPNGGTVSPSSATVEIGQKVSTAGTLPIPTREGYAFKGWYTSATGSTLARDTVVMGNITIYAQWTAITVKFTNKKNATLDIGKTLNRTAQVLPSDASNMKVKYKTSNNKIAAVDSNGKVTAKGAGVATITAAYGKIQDSYKVFVKPAKVKVTAKSKTSKKVSISWKKAAGAAGYEIQAATTTKGLSKAKPIKIKKASKLQYTLSKLAGKKLTGGKKIYIRMRAYTKAAGYKDLIYGDYCAKKSCTVKK